MKKIIVLLCVLYLPSSAGDWIRESIDLTINTRFSEAENLLKERMEKGDSSLAVNFYYASVLNSKMTHFENQLDEETFFKALNKVIDQGENILEQHNLSQNDKAQTEFYVGSAYGYLGFYQGQNGQWFRALSNGEKAYNYLSQAVETDSTIWDAYLGLGAYKYWLSTKIYWIPLIPDQRDEGIRLIKKTINHNSYSKYMAMHQLIYILLDYGQFDEAKELAEKVVSVYPESTFMRWAQSHVYMKMKDLPKAIECYKVLLDQIDNDSQANPHHRITCLARLADMYTRSDSCMQAQNIKHTILNDAYFKNHNNDDEVDRLLREISERCSDNK